MLKTYGCEGKYLQISKGAMVGCRVDQHLSPFRPENTIKHQSPPVAKVGFNGAKHFFTLAGANHLSENALPVAHTCICAVDDLHSILCPLCQLCYLWLMDDMDVLLFSSSFSCNKESQKLGLTKQVTRGGVHLDPKLPCWALRQLKWQDLYLLKIIQPMYSCYIDCIITSFE